MGRRKRVAMQMPRPESQVPSARAGGYEGGGLTVWWRQPWKIAMEAHAERGWRPWVPGPSWEMKIDASPRDWGDVARDHLVKGRLVQDSHVISRVRRYCGRQNEYIHNQLPDKHLEYRPYRLLG